jgi:hypothetical protein
MTQPRDIERLLDQWFADGSSVAPDRVVDIVADRIERQPQRPAWRLDWRHFTMSPLAKAGAAIAAVVLIALVGYTLLPGRSTGVGGPAPTASPTVIPSATPSVTPAATQAGVQPLPDAVLTAGTYSMDHINGMTITATVPDGWRGIPGFGLAGPSDYDAPLGLSIVFLQVSGAYDDPCHWDKARTGDLNQPGEQIVGPTVDDLVADIRANTAYTSTTPIDVTIDGHTGKQLDLQLPSTLSFESCDKEKSSDVGAYFPLIGGIYALGPGNIWHTRIVDVDGSRLIVLVTDYELTPADVRADAQTIIDSIKISKT